MSEETTYTEQRLLMVHHQIEWRGVRNTRVVEAMRSVPRHLFVPPEERDRAYDDGPLAIAEGQTISQPYIVAVMTDLLELKGNECVLEIGTGSGYQAAILSQLAREVHTIERFPRLAHEAQALLRDLGYNNVHVHVGDGTLGLVEHAPYRGILVTAAAPTIPQALLDQLDVGGILVIPVGGREGQDLQRWERVGDRLEQESIFPVAFVPLRGKNGWSEEDWERRPDQF